MGALLRRFLRWLGFGGDSEPTADGEARDPYSRKPAPVRSGPKTRSGAVAVAEPDD